MSERTYLTEDIREAVEQVLPRVLRDIARDRTPTDGLSTEAVRALARAEAQAEGDRAQKECVESGPICGVWEEIGKMRTEIATVTVEQTKLLAVLSFWKWALPIVVTVVGIVVGVVAPRLWPVSSHASTLPPHDHPTQVQPK